MTECYTTNDYKLLILYFTTNNLHFSEMIIRNRFKSCFNTILKVIEGNNKINELRTILQRESQNS